jgi:hypothetical protein
VAKLIVLTVIGAFMALIARSAFFIGVIYTLSQPQKPHDAHVPLNEPGRAVAAAIDAIRRDPEAARLAAQLALAALASGAEPNERVQLRALVAEIARTPQEMLSSQR